MSAEQLSALVVDDDQEILSLIREVLASNNFAVRVTDNGTEALKILEKGRYHVVVTNIKMPGLDGFQVVAGLRRLGLDLPIIGLTGMEDLGQAILEKSDGLPRKQPDLMLAKPFTYEEFYEAIESVSDRIAYG